MRIRLTFYIFFVLFFYGIFSAKAQVERRLSFHGLAGMAIYPANLKLASSNLPQRVFGGFKPGIYLGVGGNFRLWKSLYLTETWTYQQSSKEFFTTNAKTFHTGLRYNFFNKKPLRPYIGVNYNFAMVNLLRNENSSSVSPNATDVFGGGILINNIQYNFNSLNLSNLSMHGMGASVGLEYKLNKYRKKISLFTEYSVQAYAPTRNETFNFDYFYNTSAFLYQSVSVGVRFHMYKPEKQLLATLNRDEWRNDKPVDVKGTLVYKNNKKLYNKSLEVELDDTAQTKLSEIQSDEKGLIFLAKDVQIGDYKFMFEKRKRRIIRADLQILNYNKIEIADEELELEMIETELSENLLSRDGNFSVLLREGFQHEIMLSTTAENIMGTVNLSDPKCRIRIYLKDLKDSVISYIDTLAQGNTFNFVDIAPGQYKLQFVRMDDKCAETEFDYSFTGTTPYVNKQSNTDEPEDTTPVYSVVGKVLSEKKSGVQKGTIVKLIGSDGHVETSVPVDSKGEYSFNKLNDPNYRVFYEDPTDKAKLSYSIKDRKSKELKNVQYGAGKKLGSGKIVVKGKVATTKAEDASKITVMLIDSSGKIRKKMPLSPDGSFNFSGLAANKYKVVYESTDPFLRGTLKYRVEDPDLKITKLTLPDMRATAEVRDTIHVTKQEVVEVVNDSATRNDKKIVPRKKMEYPPVAYKNFKSNTTYTIDGYEVKPTGYGLQLASFFVYTNLDGFCKKLREKGVKNVFIQVVIKDKTNPQAGFIYRVMIEDTEDKDKILKQIPTYIDKGYDPVLRRHLQ
jgi:hypothetical protein